MHRTPFIYLTLGALTALSLACSLTSRLAPQPTPVPSLGPVWTVEVAATATPAPVETPTAPPAAPVVTVTSSSLQRETADPPAIVDLQYPVLAESEGVNAAPFNAAVQDLIARLLQSFEEAAQAPLPPDAQTGANSIYLTYEVRASGPRVLSIYYSLSTYAAGAAHPLPWSEAMNYDLRDGKLLGLADLFQPDFDYLGFLSVECLAELERQAVMEWEDGAAPLEQNFKSWNVTVEGLQVTFDPYQVASYAAGFQTVTIPWERLTDGLRDDLKADLLPLPTP